MAKEIEIFVYVKFESYPPLSIVSKELLIVNLLKLIITTTTNSFVRING